MGPRERSAQCRPAYFSSYCLGSLRIHSGDRNAFGEYPDGTAKVVEGLITAIGFLGGGAILKHGTSVRGTATAASIWATGAIGTAAGLGSYDVAVTIAAFTFLTLKLLPFLKEDPNSTAD